MHIDCNYFRHVASKEGWPNVCQVLEGRLVLGERPNHPFTFRYQTKDGQNGPRVSKETKIVVGERWFLT